MRGQDLENIGRTDSKSLDDVVVADSPTGSPSRHRRRPTAAPVHQTVVIVLPSQNSTACECFKARTAVLKTVAV